MQVKKSAESHAMSKLGTIARKDSDARVVRRQAKCLGTCDRTDSQLKAAGATKLSALVASSGYGRRILCLDCLELATKPAGYWPSVHGQGDGKHDWRIEVRPFGAPKTQEGVAVQMFHHRKGQSKRWTPCATEGDEIAWRKAEPSLKWLDELNTLEFQGLKGTVQVWCRLKGDTDWTFRARFAFRGAAHMGELLQACKL